ncbi:PDZ domain-containing protein [Leucobacter zeae]|nr:PDZ domain-containing protein [Leucobacter zeae]
MRDEAAERRRSRVLGGVAIAACAVLLASVIPSPYSIERPGPVVDTLGDVMIEDEATPVIKISGAETHPTDGALNLLTVSITGSPEDPASWLSLVPAVFDPSQRIAPRTDFYPEGVSDEDREAQNTVLMDASQTQAAAAAFRALGKPVGVELGIGGVSEGGPSEGELEPGDRILSVAGDPVADFSDLRERIVAAGAGDAVAIGIERDGERRTVDVVPRIPEGGDEPMIGAVITSDYDLPADVEFTLSQIGGPSAGMIFAIGVYDLLTPGDLLGGLSVSGTGTITDAGEVGAIGGLEQKLWAASRAGTDLMLIPVDNCADLPDRIPGGLDIAPVSTLDEALAAVEAAASGRRPVGVERCDAAA